MEQNKEYYAFISYKREDEKWAKWLQHKLEHYRFPTNLNGRTDLPKNIRPTFRDMTDLTPGVLAAEIDAALRNSQWLIVVCSPRSAKSPWVCKEAQTFIDLGRADHIIPFVIEGTPFSDDPNTECYPEALLNLTGDRELLATNINEMGRDAAAIKVVARMFGLKFDTLWRRHEREQRRKRWLIVTGSILFALFSLAVGAYVARMNIQLDKANANLTAVNKEVLAARDRANTERDRAEEATNSLRTAYDSITRQNDLIQQQNAQLAEERDNVLKTNWKMMENQARFVAEKAVDLVEEGDSYMGLLLAMNVLPENVDNTNRPYTEEAEYALRNAFLQETSVLRGHSSDIISVDFSSDGNLLVTSAFDNTIRIWDVYTGKCIHAFKSGDWIYRSVITSASFSPDQKSILQTNSQSTIAIYDSETCEVKMLLKGHGYGGITSAFYNKDGRFVVSASWDKTVRVWDAETGKCIHVIKEPGEVNYAIFSKEGQYIISASEDKSIRIWDTKSWQCLHVLKGHTSSVNKICVSPDDEFLVSASKDNTLRIWKIDEGKCIHVLRGHTAPVNSVSISQDGNHIASGSDDGTIRIWDLKTGKCLSVKSSQSTEVNDVAYSPNGDFLVSTLNKTICIWKIKNDFHILNGHDLNISTVSFSPDGQFVVSSSEDKTIRIWDVNSYTCEKILRGHKKPLLSAIFNENGNLIVSSDGNSVRLWNAITGDCLLNLNTCNYDNNYYAYFDNDDKHIVSVSLDSIRIWNATTGQHIRSIVSLAAGESTFRKKGHAIISPGMEFVIILFDIDKKDWSIPIMGDDKYLYANLSPNGKYIVASNDEKIEIRENSTGEILKKLEGHTNDVVDACFSPNGRYIVSASNDSTIRIWDVHSGKCLQLFNRIKDSPVSVAYSPDGGKIVAGYSNGEVVILPFPSLQDLIDETRKRFKDRQLTPEERKKYYLE